MISIHSHKISVLLIKLTFHHSIKCCEGEPEKELLCFAVIQHKKSLSNEMLQNGPAR
jgi:hypothetical protein